MGIETLFAPSKTNSSILNDANRYNKDDLKKMSVELKDIIIKKSFRKDFEHPFTLASGRKSPYYFNLKNTILDPIGCYLTGLLLFEYYVKPNQITAVGGLETGAIPVVVSLIRYAHDVSEPLEGFYVKKMAKDHGEPNKRIEGNLSPDAKILIVDDVITDGNSVLQAIDLLEELNMGTIALVVSILQRKADGRKTIESKGLRYESLFTEDDIVE